MGYFDREEEKTITTEEHDKIVKKLRENNADEARNLRWNHADSVRDLRIENETIKANSVAEVARLKADHEIALKKEAHKLAVVADERVLEAEKRAVTAETQVAVLTKEVEMSGKVEDVGAEVLNVQNLVTSLIDKLPNIDISTLSVTASVPANKGGDGKPVQPQNKS